jgi:hypothetical protein
MRCISLYSCLQLTCNHITHLCYYYLKISSYGWDRKAVLLQDSSLVMFLISDIVIILRCARVHTSHTAQLCSLYCRIISNNTSLYFYHTSTQSATCFAPVPALSDHLSVRLSRTIDSLLLYSEAPHHRVA